jgi:hypothetical protein
MIAVAAVARSGAAAEDSQFLYREGMLVGGYSTRDQWISESGSFLKTAVGFDYVGQLYGPNGEALLWDVQARLTYDSRLTRWEQLAIEMDDAWVEYQFDPEDAIRGGHFAPCFGLEPSVDTHATLFQTLQEVDIGYKSDWGVAYRRMADNAELAMALQAGTGMGLVHRDNSFLASARLGGDAGPELRAGVSALFGNVLYGAPSRTLRGPNYSNDTIRKARIGVDAQSQLGPWLWRGEASFGRDSDNTVVGLLGEANYTIPELPDVTITAQARAWSDDTGHSEQSRILAGLGASWKVLPEWTVRGAAFREERPDIVADDTRVLFQLYYYAK